MITNAIIVFLILLFGLLLASFLGVNSNIEGLENNNNGSNAGNTNRAKNVNANLNARRTNVNYENLIFKYQIKLNNSHKMKIKIINNCCYRWNTISRSDYCK